MCVDDSKKDDSSRESTMRLANLLLMCGIVRSALPDLGARVLSYLHGRGEALNITTPAPIKAVYINTRDAANPARAVMAAATAGFNVIIARLVLSWVEPLLYPSHPAHFAQLLSHQRANRLRPRVAACLHHKQRLDG